MSSFPVEIWLVGIFVAYKIVITFIFLYLVAFSVGSDMAVCKEQLNVKIKLHTHCYYYYYYYYFKFILAF